MIKKKNGAMSAVSKSNIPTITEDKKSQVLKQAPAEKVVPPRDPLNPKRPAREQKISSTKPTSKGRS